MRRTAIFLTCILLLVSCGGDIADRIFIERDIPTEGNFLVDGKYFDTLQEAVDAAGSKGVVRQMRDAEDKGAVIKDSVEIDFGRKKLNLKGSPLGIRIEANDGAIISFNNGEITSSEGNTFGSMISSGGNGTVRLNGMEIDATKVAANAVSVSSGRLIFDRWSSIKSRVGRISVAVTGTGEAEWHSLGKFSGGIVISGSATMDFTKAGITDITKFDASACTAENSHPLRKDSSILLSYASEETKAKADKATHNHEYGEWEPIYAGEGQYPESWYKECTECGFVQTVRNVLVTIDFNGGQGERYSVPLPEDERFRLPEEEPQREGYTFEGWGYFFGEEFPVIPTWGPGDTVYVSEDVTMVPSWEEGEDE